MGTREQFWLDREKCRAYWEILEIDSSDVHFGWLAPGERELRLIDLDIASKNVLDIGCGGGENLIALAKSGANCYGIDISPVMLEFAEENFRKTKGIRNEIILNQERMQALLSFESVSFDLVLSVYSLEFVESLADFRLVLYRVFERLNPKGLFLFCFSHPLQNDAFERTINTTDSIDGDASSPVIFSFADVVRCLSEVGFSIERVVEQRTESPGTMTYAQQRKFPYRWKDGKSPCSPVFDSISNRSPHTVIYKVRKPATVQTTSMANTALRLVEMGGKIRIWDEEVDVVSTTKMEHPPLTFFQFNPWDGVVGVAKIAEFNVTHDDIAFRSSLELPVDGDRKVEVPKNSLLGIAYQQLDRLDIKPVFQEMEVGFPELGGAKKMSIFLSEIPRIRFQAEARFPGKGFGVLFFVNGKEPNRATASGEEIVPRLDDKITVVYVVTEKSGWRPNYSEPVQLRIL